MQCGSPGKKTWKLSIVHWQKLITIYFCHCLWSLLCSAISKLSSTCIGRSLDKRHVLSSYFTDIDECLTGESRCSGDRCRNTVGSYTCIPCLPGFVESEDGLCIGTHALWPLVSRRRSWTTFNSTCCFRFCRRFFTDKICYYKNNYLPPPPPILLLLLQLLHYSYHCYCVRQTRLAVQ